MAQLIVFYSRADENYFNGQYQYITIGNTEKVANIIAEIIGADLFKLEQETAYATDYKTCIEQAKKDKQQNARPKLKALPKTLDKYDEIYLGYPNYWGTMPMAVYTFLEAFDFTGKKIHPFCTHEGSGLGMTQQEISQTAKGAEVTNGLAVVGSKVDLAKPAITKWIQTK